MRNFAIVLGCLAWVLSCFDAVSYYHAAEQQHVVQTRLEKATAEAASTQAFAGQDGERLRERLRQDQAAVDNDQRALGKAHRAGPEDAQDRQALAADQAAVAADRMMQYTVENFTRAEPNPQVTAATDKVQTDRRLLAETVITKARDRRLTHVLLAFWVVVGGTALLAWRGGRRVERVAKEAWPEDEDETGMKDELATAEEIED